MPNLTLIDQAQNLTYGQSSGQVKVGHDAHHIQGDPQKLAPRALNIYNSEYFKLNNKLHAPL